MTAETILPAQPHHQAILVWSGDELFCLETYVIAWKLLPKHAEPIFAENVLDAFKADYKARHA